MRSQRGRQDAIVGFGAAASQTPSTAELAAHFAALRLALVERLTTMEDVRLHLPQSGVPYIVNLSLIGFRSETVLNFLAARGIFVSSGSACSKGSLSPVLQAMGVSEAEIDGSLRISFSRENTVQDVEIFCEALLGAVHTLQRRHIG